MLAAVRGWSGGPRSCRTEAPLSVMFLEAALLSVKACAPEALLPRDVNAVAEANAVAGKSQWLANAVAGGM